MAGGYQKDSTCVFGTLKDDHIKDQIGEGICKENLCKLVLREDPLPSKAIQLSLIFERSEEHNTQLSSNAKEDTVKTSKLGRRGSIFHVSQNLNEPHSSVVPVSTVEGSIRFHVISSALHMANKGRPASSGSTTASAAGRILSSPRSVTEVPRPEESMVPRPDPSMKLKRPLTHISLTLLTPTT